MRRFYQWMRANWERVRHHVTPAAAGVPEVRTAQPGVAVGQTLVAARQPGAAVEQPGAAVEQPGAAVGQSGAAARQSGAAVGQSGAAARQSGAAASASAAGPAPAVAAPSPSPLAPDAAAEGQPPDEAGYFGALWRLFLPLRPVSLDEPARRRFSGLLFVGAISFVEQVADALEHAPHLWPRASAADFRARQERAHFWFLLHRTLIYMTELAGDSYLHAQGTLIADAMDVVQTQRLAEEGARLAQHDPCSEPAPVREGRGALAGARLILLQRSGRKHRQRQRARRERGQALLPRRGASGARPAPSPTGLASSPTGLASDPRRRRISRLVGEITS